jgi:hypothetical protein
MHATRDGRFKPEEGLTILEATVYVARQRLSTISASAGSIR